MADRSTIREAELGERALLEALQWRASLALDEYREALIGNPTAIDLPSEQIVDGDVFVFERDDEVLGFMVLLEGQDGQAELDGLFVEPSSWRRGLGRELVMKACAVAADRGASTMHVVANPSALEFYQACGFVPTETTETQFGTAIEMTLSLKQR